MLTGRTPPGGRRAFDPALRIGVVAFLMLVGFAFLFIRLGYIQLGQFGGRMENLKERMWSSRYVYPRRGNILDRQGRVLAASVPVVSLYAHPPKIRDRQALALKLSKLSLLPITEGLERLSGGHSFVWLVRGIDRHRWEQIRNEFDRVEGVGVIPEFRRQYSLAAVGSNILGFVGVDGAGLAGVEYAADGDLTGDVKSLRVELGDHGMPVIVDPEGRENPAFRGKDVVLAVDAYVQEASDNILAETVEKVEAKSGSIVVLKVWTGEILAMSSYPSFDPNRFWEFPSTQYLHQAVNRVFEPGSTFKLVTIASILSDHPSSVREKHICRGSYVVPNAGHTLRCYASHGPVDFRRAVEVSCNVGIIESAMPGSKESFFRMIQNFGFGIESGVRLPGEERGILRKPHRWSLLSRPSLAIGQEVGVTNIQLAMAMAAVANGGNLVKPQLMKEPRAQAERAERAEPVVVRRVIKPDVAAAVREFLVWAVEGDEATGKKAKIAGMRVGGKTGTAQIARPGGGYEPNQFVSSFIGFFPADRPDIVISVVIHQPNPSIAHFGGDVAAPAFAKLGETMLKLASH